MGKAIFITPAYLSLAWTLMITYQMFTETAVKTVMGVILVQWPQVGQILSARVDTIVFIYAFSWIFLLSSVIPSILLGKDRGVIIQFVIVLVLTIISLVVQDVLFEYTGVRVEHLFGLAVFLQNSFIASIFLSAPYVLMASIDVYGRMKKRDQFVREERLLKLVLLQDKKIEALKQGQSSPNTRRRTQE